MEVSKLDQVLNALSACVIFIDQSRKITFANAAAKSRFGEDIEDESLVRIVRNPEFLSAIDRINAGDDEAHVELTIGATPSATFDVKLHALGEGLANKAKIAITFEDVSQMRDAQLMRSEFVANVSHELRSPLTALAGFIETLRGPARDDTDARQRFLALMENEAARMKRLIDDLLSLSKLQGKERIRPSGEVDVVQLLDHVIATLSPVADKEQKTIRVSNHTDQTLIIGDHDELIQVFHNIVENAIKYGALDSAVDVNIDRSLNIGAVEGPAIVVTVKDEGQGIQAEDIPRLTERFYRADKSRSRIKGGTGLGLAIVKHILNRHRGRLEIESKLGEGSTFQIILPVGRN